MITNNDNNKKNNPQGTYREYFKRKAVLRRWKKLRY